MMTLRFPTNLVFWKDIKLFLNEGEANLINLTMAKESSIIERFWFILCQKGNEEGTKLKAACQINRLK